MTRPIVFQIMIAGCFSLAAGACTVGGDGGGAKEADGDQLIGASAGGETNIISDAWAESTVRFGNNVKMLNFRQLKSEVARATGVASYDWGNNGDVFGAADFQTSFHDDLTPGATKIITLRKIAFDVCAKMIAAETTTPALFSAMSPKAAVSAQDPKLAEQVKLVFTRFFMEEPTPDEADVSTKAVVMQIAAGATPAAAWAGLCVGYITSMRFLSY